MISSDCMTQHIWSEQWPLFSLYLLKCTLTYLVNVYPNIICLEMRLLLLSLSKVRLIYAADNNRMSLCFQYWNAHNLLIPTSVVLWPVIFSPFPFPTLNLYCNSWASLSWVTGDSASMEGGRVGRWGRRAIKRFSEAWKNIEKAREPDLSMDF